MDERAEQNKTIMRILAEDFGIHSEAELNAAIRSQPLINLAPFCAPVDSRASGGQSHGLSDGRSRGQFSENPPITVTIP